jgi:hypothetical protein
MFFDALWTGRLPHLQNHPQWLCGSRANLPQLIEINGGRAGTRTPDLLRVKQTFLGPAECRRNPALWLHTPVAFVTCTPARADFSGIRRASADVRRLISSGIWGKSAGRCSTGSIYRSKSRRCHRRSCGREKLRHRRKKCGDGRSGRRRLSVRGGIAMRGCRRGRSARIALWMKPANARSKWPCGG